MDIKSVGFVEYNKISSESDAFLSLDKFSPLLEFKTSNNFKNKIKDYPLIVDSEIKNNILEDESTFLIKINPFDKNCSTKIKSINHRNDEYSIKIVKNKTNELTNNDQRKLIFLTESKQQNFELKPREFKKNIEKEVSEFDYKPKQIYEIKPQQDNSKLMIEIKKELDESIEIINKNQDRKIDETNKFITQKFNEFDKQIKIVIKEELKDSEDKLLIKTDERNKKELENFKRNLLRS